ncbi:MAG: hypothetical protein CMO80_00990 [Verrucomicrobiales bacterium]|nr:hypothetical protein [Verrucomicrobiales bacterium]|tara:strand:- start:115 stop:549 length:435 start_codon:yes stop_codon:yes gene_type:complete
MQEPEELNPADREFELALGRMQPANTGIDQGEFAFQLGRASVQRQVNSWRATSAVLAVCLVGLMLGTIPRNHGPVLVESPVFIEPVADEPTLRSMAYLGVRDAVLRDEMDELDDFLGSDESSTSQSPNPSNSYSAQALRNELIN